MFIYELVTLRQPFAGQDAAGGGAKEVVLEGGRPAVTPAEAAASPTYLLDLMVACWEQRPRARPSASQIVSVASAPEFARLVDVASLEGGGDGGSGDIGAGAQCSACAAVQADKYIDII